MINGYFCIIEYGCLCSEEYAKASSKGNIILPKEIFKQLENFALENSEFLTIGYKKGLGKILKAQNYVGLIQTKSNVVIEILPKIYSEESDGSYERTRKIFLKMLMSLKNTSFKSINLSSLKSGKLPIFDVFIKMFLGELSTLIKKGLKSNYISLEGNEKFYKGKLLVNKHIAQNIVHKERFFIEFDDYSKNRPENKLIKAALLFLKTKTNNFNLQSQIDKFIFTMNEIEASKNIEKDLSKCTGSRLMSEYDIIVKWCKIFLKHESFTNYKGNNVAYALLFPMEKVFESYVAKAMKDSQYFRNWAIYSQDRGRYLIENPQKFALRPDIVIKQNDSVLILDTKWKLLNNEASNNFGISQGDMYQMYAYAKKYNCEDIFLLYPRNEFVMNLKNEIRFTYEGNLKLHVFFIDLDNIRGSLKELSAKINKK
ncbi:McrC family protein [Clostridium sp. CX1]|uniref:McrC family protein n=1 Tax=Clostridium sp. CX1 TaxID=2978346 RepID=UPI0021BFE62B|nr:McrC family protein [Clostridium sp. CX1]MCT8977879.1 McrC family protein [Clostridium sp. CX1]